MVTGRAASHNAAASSFNLIIVMIPERASFARQFVTPLKRA
jgi:hypothetical protein